MGTYGEYVQAAAITCIWGLGSLGAALVLWKHPNRDMVLFLVVMGALSLLAFAFVMTRRPSKGDYWWREQRTVRTYVHGPGGRRVVRSDGSGDISFPEDMPPEIAEMVERALRGDGPIEAPTHHPGGGKSTSTTTFTFDVEPGGDVLIRPKTEEELEAGKSGPSGPYQLHHQGTSLVLEVKTGDIDPSHLGLKVTSSGFEVRFPKDENAYLAKVAVETMDDTAIIRIGTGDVAVPDRAWADLWEDRLRIHLPLGRGKMFERELRPIVRDGPAPPLPPVPEHMRRRAPVNNLVVHDRGASFEVQVGTDPAIRGSLDYQVDRAEVTLTHSYVRRDRTTTGLETTDVTDNYVLRLPEHVHATSAYHVKDDEGFHIWLPKVETQEGRDMGAG